MNSDDLIFVIILIMPGLILSTDLMDIARTVEACQSFTCVKQ